MNECPDPPGLMVTCRIRIIKPRLYSAGIIPAHTAVSQGLSGLSGLSGFVEAVSAQTSRTHSDAGKHAISIVSFHPVAVTHLASQLPYPSGGQCLAQSKARTKVHARRALCSKYCTHAT